MDYHCNQGKADYSDIQDRALGVRYVRYKWCANEPCMYKPCMYSLNMYKYKIVFILFVLSRVLNLLTEKC